MADFKLSTPIAFTIFNRPEKTAKVFAEIARVKPPKLLIVADGPRKDREGEAELCLRARRVAEGVDWPCEVVTHYSDVNLGCKARMATGLSWVFKTVPEAIILEDDCIPHPSFFRFCEELLERYRENEKIMMIGGTNFQGGARKGGESYYFSQIPSVWGWASWSRAWNKYYDVEMKLWPEYRDSGAIRELFHDKDTEDFWSELFARYYSGKIDTWEYPWICASFRHKLVSIVPNANLIQNIGFGADATHTLTEKSALADREIRELQFPLVHPKEIQIDTEADAIFQKTIAGRGYRRRLLRKVRSFLRWAGLLTES